MTDQFENPMGLNGYEFVEFASPNDNPLEPVFEMLGFTKVANHRSKDVALYRYRELAPDCMGQWMVYWRQNMPGYRNPCVDDRGKPMKNWWVFLYY